MGMNVLIVDDSTLTRKAIRRMIDMVGIDVEDVLEAGDGLEALDILAVKQVDIVLADLNMPKMDGIEMIYHMRGNENTKSIPVVIVSTESSASRIEGLLTDGVKNYLHKPFTPEKFKEMLTQTIGAA